MNQDKQLIDALKLVLKQKNITYKHVAEFLNVSEGTVKRLFSQYDFSLRRLQNVCEFANIELSDLFEMIQANLLSTEQLTTEQEELLVSDTKLLLTAHLLVNKWTVNQILSHYNIDKIQMTRLLAVLDKINFIEYLPGERVRLKVSRTFSWIEGGPIQQFYRQQIQSEFLDFDFTNDGEIKLFLSGMLTKDSNAEMMRKIKSLSAHFNDLHNSDSSLPLDEKYGTSLVIAMRPWELELFARLRKEETIKTF